jgi:hypothetical protein
MQTLARGCWSDHTRLGMLQHSWPTPHRHGVDCDRVVVVVVVGGGCTAIVVVRSELVVWVVGPDPQAASSAVPPSSVAAKISRVVGFVLVMVISPFSLSWRVGPDA